MVKDCSETDTIMTLADLGRTQPLKAVEVLARARALCQDVKGDSGACVLCGMDGNCEMSRSLIKEAIALIQYPDRYEAS